jgi:hypothetical protein
MTGAVVCEPSERLVVRDTLGSSDDVLGETLAAAARRRRSEWRQRREVDMARARLERRAQLLARLEPRPTLAPHRCGVGVALDVATQLDGAKGVAEACDAPPDIGDVARDCDCGMPRSATAACEGCEGTAASAWLLTVSADGLHSGIGDALDAKHPVATRGSAAGPSPPSHLPLSPQSFRSAAADGCASATASWIARSDSRVYEVASGGCSDTSSGGGSASGIASARAGTHGCAAWLLETALAAGSRAGGPRGASRGRGGAGVPKDSAQALVLFSATARRCGRRADATRRRPLCSVPQSLEPVCTERMLGEHGRAWLSSRKRTEVLKRRCGSASHRPTSCASASCVSKGRAPPDPSAEGRQGLSMAPSLREMRVPRARSLSTGCETGSVRMAASLHSRRGEPVVLSLCSMSQASFWQQERSSSSSLGVHSSRSAACECKWNDVSTSLNTTQRSFRRSTLLCWGGRASNIPVRYPGIVSTDKVERDA